MRHDYGVEYGNIRMRPLAHEDIESLRAWRNNHLHSKYLSRIPYITAEMQEIWFDQYLTNERIFTWAIDETATSKRLVGSVSLYSFRENICELGKTMIAPDAIGQGIGTKAEALCAHAAFSKFGFSVIDAYVDVDNIAATKKMLKNGLSIQCSTILEGIKNYYFTINKERFYRMHSELAGVEIITSADW